MRRRLYGSLASGGVETISVIADSGMKSVYSSPCIDEPSGDTYDLVVDGVVIHKYLSFNDTHLLDVPAGFVRLDIAGFNAKAYKEVDMREVVVNERVPFLVACPSFLSGKRGDIINLPEYLYFPDGGKAGYSPVTRRYRGDTKEDGVYWFQMEISGLSDVTWTYVNINTTEGNISFDGSAFDSVGNVSVRIREDCPSDYDPYINVNYRSGGLVSLVNVTYPIYVRVID